MRRRFRRIVSALAVAVAVPLTSSGQTLVGTVRGGDGPLVGATVRLLELERVQQTGSTGGFVFRDIPTGRYRVLANMSG